MNLIPARFCRCRECVAIRRVARARRWRRLLCRLGLHRWGGAPERGVKCGGCGMDRRTRTVWQPGTLRGEPARRHPRTGEVQFILWKAGDPPGRAEDYWIRYDSTWWPQFVPAVEESGTAAPEPRSSARLVRLWGSVSRWIARRYYRKAIESLCESRIYLEKMAFTQEARVLDKPIEELARIHVRLRQSTTNSEQPGKR